MLGFYPDAHFASVVTDPPYALVSVVKRFGSDTAAPARSDGPSGVYARASSGFMGQRWDTGEVAHDAGFWAEVLRVTKPGGHLVAFAGTRTYHRLAVAIEDAGWEIRDQLAWVYGTGFPKSHDVSKAIDKAAGADREVIARIPRPNSFDDAHLGGGGYAAQEQVISAPATPEAAEWQGWGTALKPAWEPIVLARKPFDGTVAQCVLAHGTGALHIDACRVGSEPSPSAAMRASGRVPSSCKPGEYGDGHAIQNRTSPEQWAKAKPGEQLGRWPANICHDGSPEVLAGFPVTGPSSAAPRNNGDFKSVAKGHEQARVTHGHADHGGSAARFFYCPKASTAERAGSKHPTVKPQALMAWLCRMVTPPGGEILDPFAGSGTTGAAARAEGFDCTLVEREPGYADDIAARLVCG